MTTREELLNGFGEAVNIIRQLAGIQQKLNNVRASYRNTRPFKKVSLIGMILTGFWGFISLIAVVAHEYGLALAYFLFFSLPHYIVFELLKKKKNKRINEENNKIIANNEQLKIQEQSVLNELQQVQVVYRERLSSWYPENYCSVDAAEFFYDAIKNYRADSIKEAVNLYETHLHQQRVESNQQKAINQQKLNNLLTVGSLAMQGATLGAINQQTNAINGVNDTINRIHRGY